MKEVLFPQNFREKNQPHLTAEQVKKFAFTIREARYAEAYPDQSGYFVRTAALAADGNFTRGGNKEYGLSDAFVHGETAVVSSLRDETQSPIEVVAWYKEGKIGPEDFGRPCGNCRDVLRKYCTPETFFLNGNEDAVSYVRLKNYLFDAYDYLNMDHVRPREVNIAITGARGGTDIYLPDAMKPQVYGVALVSEDGTVWRGDHYTNVGYDSVTPLMCSIIAWKESYPVGEVSERHLRLARAVIVSENGIPDVFYRDRQAILEADEILRRYTKNPRPLRIELVHAKRDLRGNLIMYDAKMTNTEAWLPGPFSPGAFRMDDVMDGQLQKLTGNKPQ